MDDDLSCRYSGYPSVKHVKRPEIPASQPQKNVISTGKNPDEGHVGECKYAGTICKVCPGLLTHSGPTEKS